MKPSSNAIAAGHVKNYLLPALAGVGTWLVWLQTEPIKVLMRTPLCYLPTCPAVSEFNSFCLRLLNTYQLPFVDHQARSGHWTNWLQTGFSTAAKRSVMNWMT